MGALANAAGLRKSPEFRELVETAVAYQARMVIGEAASVPLHDLRLRMARDAAVSPAAVTPLMVTAVATTPAIALKAVALSNVTDDDILNVVAAMWNAVAGLLYPAT